MTLYSRPEANTLNADLLVSIHNNFYYIGTKWYRSVYYNKEDEKSIYGFTSQEVELIQKS